MSEHPHKIQVPDGAPGDDVIELTPEQHVSAESQARGRKRTMLFVALLVITVIAIACGVTFGLVAGESGGDDGITAAALSENDAPAGAPVQAQSTGTPPATPPVVAAPTTDTDAPAVAPRNPHVPEPTDPPVPEPTSHPVVAPRSDTAATPVNPAPTAAPNHTANTQSTGCDEDSLNVSDLAGLASPVFLIGSEPDAIDVIELISTALESATESAGFQVFLPQVVCAGADSHVDVLGALSGVDACSSLDFLKESNVLAFGVQKSGVKDTSFCAAFNPFTGTVGIGQSDILPVATVANILTLSLDSIGFSLNKDLSSTTRNKMWNNTGEPAVIDVAGHVVVRGTGVIGFKASEKVAVGITIDATLLVDADYKNDGVELVQVFREEGAVDYFPDFALLLSGSAYPTFNVSTVLKDGEELVNMIDLSEAITANVDIFTIVEQGKSSLQLATSIDVLLKGICGASSYLLILCEIFDGDSAISGSVRSYVNPNGFGIMWAVSGYIGLKSDFLELLLGWPENGIEFNSELSLTMNDDTLRVCAQAVDEGEKQCWGFCTKDSQCGSDEFCDALGACIWKKNVGGSCLKHSGCKSSICKTAFCSECSQLDTTSECPSGQYCGTLFPSALGLRCLPKLDVGAPCSNNDACDSGHCVDFFCSACPQLDSTTGCPSGQFCGTQLPSLVGLRCIQQLELGAPCSNDDACTSGVCKSLFCSECRQIDSSEGCPIGQFCTSRLPSLVGLRCEDKLPRGAPCSSGNACQSGTCGFFGIGFCR